MVEKIFRRQFVQDQIEQYIDWFVHEDKEREQMKEDLKKYYMPEVYDEYDED